MNLNNKTIRPRFKRLCSFPNKQRSNTFIKEQAKATSEEFMKTTHYDIIYTSESGEYITITVDFYSKIIKYLSSYKFYSCKHRKKSYICKQKAKT